MPGINGYSRTSPAAAAMLAGVVGLICIGHALADALPHRPALYNGDTPDMRIEKLDDRVRISIGEDHITDYITKGEPGPILYPLHGPHNLPMTRNDPMNRAEGEADDHPHHQSVWFAHEAVNGISFGHTRDNSGRIVHDELLHTQADGASATIAARNKWIGPDDRVHLKDVTRITFTAIPRGRIIDYQVTLHASEGDVVFGDAKDAGFGVRMHPYLRLRPDLSRGVRDVFGQAVNSEGVTGPAVRPKRARWIAYWGPIENKQVTFALFDHPDNLQYPTRWHARDDGLVAANPFGVHAWQSQDEPSGEITLKAGERVTFRYRMLLLDGPADVHELDRMHQAYRQERQPLNVLYVTGGGFHDFVAQEPLITEGLSARMDINWTVDHEAGTRPNFEPARFQHDDWIDPFDLVIFNKSISRIPDEQQKDLTRRIVEPIHDKGIPAVVIHGTMHFGRNVDQWHDFTGVVTRRHERRRAADIRNIAPEHPIMHDFPEVWRPDIVEPYIVLEVRPQVTPLAEVYGRGNDTWFICYWTHQYGNAPVFGTTIGHENKTVADPIFLNTLARGIAWTLEQKNKPNNP